MPFTPFKRHIIGQGGAIIRNVLTQHLSAAEMESDATRLKSPKNCKSWQKAASFPKPPSSVALQREHKERPIASKGKAAFPTITKLQHPQFRF